MGEARTTSLLRPVMLSPARIGENSPCDFFDNVGNLLLCQGALISENLQKKLGNRRIYCDPGHADTFSEDPLEMLAKAADTLLALDRRVQTGSSVDEALCLQLAETILDSWRIDPDACIGYTRVAQAGTPSQCQAILAALFVAELGNAHAFTRHELIELVGAALTMNLGSMALHDEMAEVTGPLSTTLRRRMTEHPARAAQVLRDIGMPAGWSLAVLQHHENLNGSGYPGRLERGSICLEARMLRLVDIFAARLRVRRGRGPQYWSITRARDLDGLVEHIFGPDLGSLDTSLAHLFMSRLGAFLPGSLLRLSNGEIAIVNRRSYDIVRTATLAPRIALSFLDANGNAIEPRPRRIGPQDYRVLGYAHDDLPRLPSYDWRQIWGYSREETKKM